ncbi:MAG: phosphoglycerate dehydrogenase [Spirochaetaceae bacterium]|jgi:D-3-phosphoglycerate dehydrogenase|nr:phosphoglycerate dehydrogenase [Spirochaetaceae bacterium]
MFHVKTLNNISSKGLEYFPRDRYEVGNDVANPDALLLRSADLHGIDIPKSVVAVARSGAGVNNIPVSALTERGIVVFNTPGANANAVKELTLAALFLTSRKITDAILWGQTLAMNMHPAASADAGELSRLVEKEKNNFTGPEIRGKTLGVIGLGAIGVSVANDALSLGMDVIGYDPFISVDAAWSLSRAVGKADSLESLLAVSDYITIHIPLTADSRGILNDERIRTIKKGARLLNFARGELVSEPAILAALDEDRVSVYVTDFPTPALIAHRNVICIPHLGASTPEAEENCAVMAVRQLASFLETGAVRNSVNFPACKLDKHSGHRLLIMNRNVPNMVGQITSMLAASKINIMDMINHHRDGFAYNIIDTEQETSSVIAARLQGIEGVIRVRAIEEVSRYENRR